MAIDWLPTLRASLSTLKEGLIQVLYPETCLLCGRLLPGRERYFCHDCRRAILDDPHPACPRCASTVGPFTALANDCSNCRAKTFQFDGAFRCGPYQGLLREAILRMKHLTGEPIAEAIAEVWADKARPALAATGASLVAPIPLHWFKKLRRGYNQSEALAQSFASRLNLSCRADLIRKIHNTPDQVHKNASERPGNVRGAFVARREPDLTNKTILLVDDVLTTGSTANEAAKAVRSAGAKRVFVVVLAHSQN